MNANKKWPQWKSAFTCWNWMCFGLFSVVDSLHLSFARSLVNRMQCCDKHRAKGSQFHVKHKHTHSQLMKHKSSVICFCAQWARVSMHIWSNQTKRLKVTQCKRRKTNHILNESTRWNYTIFFRLQFNLFRQTFPLFLLLEREREKKHTRTKTTEWQTAARMPIYSSLELR